MHTLLCLDVDHCVQNYKSVNTLQHARQKLIEDISPTSIMTILSCFKDFVEEGYDQLPI